MIWTLLFSKIFADFQNLVCFMALNNFEWEIAVDLSTFLENFTIMIASFGNFRSLKSLKPYNFANRSKKNEALISFVF